MAMSANLGQKQKYELHVFIKNPGKCVKIRDIPVTIYANVCKGVKSGFRKFSLKSDNIKLKIRENPAKMCAYIVYLDTRHDVWKMLLNPEKN
jgi:hypothetical protein